MWLLFALASAVLFAVRRVYEKELTTRFGNFSLSFVLLGSASLFVLVLFFFLPIPEDVLHLPWQFWWPLLIIWFVLYPLGNYFLYQSLREGEVSQVTPVSTLLPVFNIATSFFIIHEFPNFFGLTGVVLTVLATFILLTDTPERGKQRFNRPVLLMLGNVLCSALGSTLDKIAIEASTPAFYAFANMFGASIVFLLLAYAYDESHELPRVKERWGTFALLGVALAFAFVAFSTAFALGPTSYVLAVRSGGLLIAALWGLFVLRESLSRKKFSALLLFVAGTIALAIS